MPRADIPHQGHPGPPQHPSSGESRSPLPLFQQPPTPLPGQPVVPCWPGRKGSATLAFRRLWAVASFCFRACISEASLDGGGEQGRVSLLPRHQSRRRPGTGLEPHGVCLGPQPASCLCVSPGRPTWRPWPRLRGPELGCRSRQPGRAWSPHPGPAQPRCVGPCCPAACTAHPAAAAPEGQVRGSCRLRGQGQKRDQARDGVGVGVRAGAGAGAGAGIGVEGAEVGVRTGQRQGRAWREVGWTRGGAGWGGRGQGQVGWACTSPESQSQMLSTVRGCWSGFRRCGRGATSRLPRCRSPIVFSAMTSFFSSACGVPGGGGSGQACPVPTPSQASQSLAFVKWGSLGQQSKRSPSLETQDPWVCGVGWRWATQHHPGLRSESPRASERS